DHLLFCGYILTLEIKAYIVYDYTILRMFRNMNINSKNEEIRWQVIKAMLNEFPTLKERVKKYLKSNQ
ncbi:hypothetical protein KAI31_03240, partial [Candidatus Bathyarchaeota archaeon]|nr:hypothetical protein [Candidatus Bathyarchaeota archaeon]